MQGKGVNILKDTNNTALNENEEQELDTTPVSEEVAPEEADEVPVESELTEEEETETEPETEG